MHAGYRIVSEVVSSSFTEKKNARCWLATGRFDSRFIEREKGFEPSERLRKSSRLAPSCNDSHRFEFLFVPRRSVETTPWTEALGKFWANAFRAVRGRPDIS